MTALALPRPAAALTDFDIGPISRTMIGVAAFAMTALCAVAVTRWLAGIAPAHPHIRELAIAIHLSAVLPAVPLGGYVLLARKGDARHRMLGKLWLALMVLTALSAIFVQTSGSFSWIHIFVPTTLLASWRVITTARTGRIAAHKRSVVFLYVTGLILPGLFTFLPGRLLGTWLLG
jgi:uncharacterized membrane protein